LLPRPHGIADLAATADERLQIIHQLDDELTLCHEALERLTRPISEANAADTGPDE
jgi:hypothetical protein